MAVFSIALGQVFEQATGLWNLCSHFWPLVIVPDVSALLQGHNHVLFVIYCMVLHYYTTWYYLALESATFSKELGSTALLYYLVVKLGTGKCHV
jgi:hypothetical protein